MMLALAAGLTFVGRFATRAVLGEPPAPLPADDRVAPGEPVPPGLVGAARSDGGEAAAATWEDEYFPFIGFEREPSDASLVHVAPTAPGTGPEMVRVAAGTAALGDPAIPGARPVHTVALKSFWLDRTEVTQAAFHRFVVETRRAAPSTEEAWALPYA